MKTDRKALLWTSKDKKLVQCNVCHNKCILAPGQVARCSSRQNIDGEMQLLTYGMLSSIAVDPIEKKPLFHFYPGTKVFSIGGWGCNFKCAHCQNWSISQASVEDINEETEKRFGFAEKYLSPDEFIEMAKQYNCQGVSWTYNEPTIWFEYTLDCAKLAKEHGLYTAYITNGFITPEALQELAPYLGAFRVDFKSFDDKFYQEICGVKGAKGVFETTLKAKELGMHIECVTNIIPTKNDSEDNLKNIAHWIAENLGGDTPWHVTRFFPCYKLKDLVSTPKETLDKAVEIGKQAGLNFIYEGNIREETNTICPDCGKVAIKRDYFVDIDITKKGDCTKCGRGLNIVTG